MNAPFVIHEVNRPTPEQASAMVAACAPMIARLIRPYLQARTDAAQQAAQTAKPDEVERMDETKPDVIEIEGLGTVELANFADDAEAEASVAEEFARMGVDPDAPEDEEGDGDEL